MAEKSTRRTLILSGAAAVAALGLGIWTSLQLRSRSGETITKSMAAITIIPGGRLLPALQLVNQNGQSIGTDAFSGHWSLVFMGFTNCGDVCPTTMAKLRMLSDRVTQPLDIVFVSVDPGRDTPEVIKRYVEKFDKDFVGMTGTPEQIEVFAAALTTPYFVDESAENYTVDHSSTLFLINPDAALVGVITPPLDIELIAADLGRLL
jgi:protein SCO1/2